MKKLLSLTALVLLICAMPALAQTVSGPISITAQDAGNCATANACASFDITKLSAFSLEVTGTWTGTMTFQCRSFGTFINVLPVNVTSGAAASTTTANGTFSFANNGYDRCLVKATTLGSGSVLVGLRSGFAALRSNISTSAILAQDGTAALPSISFANDSDTGFSRSVGNTIDMSTNGSTLARLDSSQASEGFTVKAAGFFQWNSNNFTPGSPSTPDTSLGRGGAAGKVVLLGTTPVIQLGGTTNSFPAIKQNGAALQLRLADDSGFTSIDLNNATIRGAITATSLLESSIGPSAPSSCGTSPAVTTNNGTAAWVITGGTGGVATGCTTTMPAATNGWNCIIANITAAAAHRANVWTVQTANTTTSVTWEYQTVSTGAATAFTASDVFRGICFAY